MASQSLISTVNGYENYIEDKGKDEQVINAYVDACSVAINGEKDIEYGLQLTKRAKELIEDFCTAKTGGTIWDLEKYAFDHKTTYELINKKYEVLLLEAQNKIVDSYFQYIEKKREPKDRFYMPRRKQLIKIGLVDALQGMIDDKYDILCVSLVPGAGKSTIAKAIAEDIGFIYVDTGAMYRAIALYFLRKGIDGHDRKLVAAECPNIHVTLEYDEEGKQQVILNGENVTGYIRKEEVGKMASVTSAVPEVRAALLDLQRDMAKTSDILMDGRDIGTNVLPDASLKIYLTASADVRAKRRYDELKEKGADCDIEQIKTDIIARDKQDMEREIAPLCQAEDAILVDSSDMSIPQVIDTIISEFKKIK
mgnify:CR=1 FL=1